MTRSVINSPYQVGDLVHYVTATENVTFEAIARVKDVTAQHCGRWRIAVPRPGRGYPTVHYYVDDDGTVQGYDRDSVSVSPLATAWIKPFGALRRRAARNHDQLTLMEVPQ